MAKLVTPVIGLAVVVALAMVAVFGAMSLTNPAFAAVGAPADAELAERVDSPQAAPMEFSATAVSGGANLSWALKSTARAWVVNISGGSTATVRLTNASEQFAGTIGVTMGDANPNAATGATVAGLVNETQYCFSVQYTYDLDGDESGTAVGGSTATDSMCVTPGAAPMGTVTPDATNPAVGAPGEVTLKWSWGIGEGSPAVAKWQYGTSTSDDTQPTSWKDLDVEGSASGYTAKVTGLDDGDYFFWVAAVSGRGVVGVPTQLTGPTATTVNVGPTFEAQSNKPGSNTRYDISIPVTLTAATDSTEDDVTEDETFSTLTEEIVIELEDYTVPSSIAESSVAIRLETGSGASCGQVTTPATTCPVNTIADSVSVSGEKISITIGDWNKDRTGGNANPNTAVVTGNAITIVLKQSAGIRNPTKFGEYGPVIEVKATHNPSNKLVDLDLSSRHVIQRIVKLSEEDGGLGDVVMVTGSGFEKNVTVHFFLNGYEGHTPNMSLDSGEDILCSAQSNADSIATCEFTVATPTFKRGTNYVNAVDGDGNAGTFTDKGDQKFVLKPSISASPAGGSPGEIMQVQLVSFPLSGHISRITLSGDEICGPAADSDACQYGNVGGQGTASIPVTVPNWAVGGVQELRVWAGGENDSVNVTIVGPRIIPTPQTVVANQRVSLVGTGFSPRAKIGDIDVTVSDPVKPEISIGGAPIGWSKVNDGRVVLVDDGGNWAASVDLPLVEATTGSGDRTIRITDSKGRTGSIDVTLAERSFDITPASGRVGTQAVVRGMGYPSKNDEGHSFTVDVIYKVQEGATARVSVVPDASGRFEVQLRIPTTASIPSTNQVEVSFDHEMGGTGVLENKQHFVPEGIIKLSATSGGPGTMVTVSGEGFKTYVPVEQVKIGTIEITPSPKPNTDANGMMTFDVLIPGLDVGIQTIEVKVGGTTSSTGFTVTESGINPGNIVEVGPGLEDLGDNFVNIWHFNNDTKAWSFYDGMEGSDLTHLITGETYLMQIKSTIEVILNGDTRNLTCVGANCWNQIVW